MRPVRPHLWTPATGRPLVFWHGLGFGRQRRLPRRRGSATRPGGHRTDRARRARLRRLGGARPRRVRHRPARRPALGARRCARADAPRRAARALLGRDDRDHRGRPQRPDDVAALVLLRQRAQRLRRLAGRAARRHVRRALAELERRRRRRPGTSLWPCSPSRPRSAVDARSLARGIRRRRRTAVCSSRLGTKCALAAARSASCGPRERPPGPRRRPPGSRRLLLLATEPEERRAERGAAPSGWGRRSPRGRGPADRRNAPRRLRRPRRRVGVLVADWSSAGPRQSPDRGTIA